MRVFAQKPSPQHGKAGPGGSSVRIQTRLTVNAPGDVYEQEAERLAEQAVASTPCSCGGSCSKCQRDKEHLQASRLPHSSAALAEAPPLVEEVLRSRGQPLDSATRKPLESRFGHDFSRVRVHTDAKAVQSAQAIDARAYTAGPHIAFGSGEYSPHTAAGRRLIAHELVHTMQQDAAPEQVQRQPKAGGAKKPVAGGACTKICGKVPAQAPVKSGNFTFCLCDLVQMDFNPGPGYAERDFQQQMAQIQQGTPLRSMWFLTGSTGAKVGSSAPAWGFQATMAAEEKSPPGETSQLDTLEYGFIQTVKNYEWKAKYTNGWAREVSVASARDAFDTTVPAPWYFTSGSVNGPVAFGTTSAILGDNPKVKMAVHHPSRDGVCNTLTEVSTKGDFHLWMIVMPMGTVPSMSNVTFIHHKSITMDKSWALANPGKDDPFQPSNWQASGTQSLTKEGSGQGPETPVLSTPVANDLIQPKNWTTVAGKRCTIWQRARFGEFAEKEATVEKPGEKKETIWDRARESGEKK